MAKFYGAIGYSETKEITPGVWDEVITEHLHSGDVLKNMNRVREGQNLTPKLALDNQISIIGDAFAYTNFQSMRYVRWMGAAWAITSVEVQRPRLLLSIGGLYNVHS